MAGLLKKGKWVLISGMCTDAQREERGPIFLEWIRQLADGMNYMHKSHIVHLDMYIYSLSQHI